MSPSQLIHKFAAARPDPELLRTPILVVDDVQDNRELLEELLRDAGYEQILLVASGIEALKVLESRADVGLVLLDLMMPVMDGYETAKRISGDPQTAHVPIIVVTGGALRRDEALLKSFERGAMDFIPKPVNEVELYGRVKSALLIYVGRIRDREKTRALAESEQRYELAVTGANDGIWDLDLLADRVYYSPQWKRILGYEDEELPNRTGMWEELVHPDDKDHALAAIHEHWDKKTSCYTSEHRLRTKRGDYKWVFSRGRALWDAAGAVVRMAGSTTDITERKVLEARLRQAALVESLSQLAAGVAHDFNNLLGVICGTASFIRMQLPTDSPLQTGLDSMEKASLRAAELCQQMLLYAGQARFSLKPLDLNSLVAETIEQFQRSLRPTVAIDLRPSDGQLMVGADAAQLGQAISQLLFNAAEAIGDHAGRITIGVAAASPRADELANAVLTPKATQSAYAQIEITDTGCGMSRETMGKIFQPFFSTKFTGRGLGLPAVLGIIRAHDGALALSSEPSRGSSFKLWLPCQEPAAAAARSTCSQP